MLPTICLFEVRSVLENIMAPEAPGFVDIVYQKRSRTHNGGEISRQGAAGRENCSAKTPQWQLILSVR